MRPVLSILILSCVCGADAVAQSKKPAEPPLNLSLTTVGRQRHIIQTMSREAQDFFDQGITLFYGFNHEGAARAFQRAAELDPASPMPLWGVALAVGPNYDLDAATLYAESLMNLNPWKLWSLDGKPAEGTEEIVRVLEFVLERNPNHA